ncbi:hypothetical protein N9013_04140 [Akkermansiaceae bacterium]|nr:hypothetical protein [Akkermansiaceae bacterium]
MESSTTLRNAAPSEFSRLRIFTLECALCCERLAATILHNTYLLSPPPITVSLIGPARRAGRGSESDFFQSLGKEIRLLQDAGAESIRLCNIDESVTLLRGPDASVGSRAQLRIQITLFVESYQRRHSAPELELDLTFDS